MLLAQQTSFGWSGSFRGDLWHSGIFNCLTVCCRKTGMLCVRCIGMLRTVCIHMFMVCRFIQEFRFQMGNFFCRQASDINEKVNQ